MTRRTALVLLAAALLALPSSADENAAAAFSEVEFAKVPRAIRVEPEYVADPLYALFLFGPRGDFRVWAVLDKSDAGLEYYDVLYLDKDGDGDLTEAAERFTGRYDEARARAGLALSISAGDLSVPGGAVHKGFRVSTVVKAGRNGTWTSLQWEGRVRVSGGASRTGFDSTVWGRSPEAAPILRPTAKGPLSFAIWGPATLGTGRTNTVSFMLGNRGSGEDTLCYLPDDFLVPGEDVVTAVLQAKDRRGRPIEIPWLFLKPC